jgi:two-component system sensor histidine kinase ResE
MAPLARHRRAFPREVALLHLLEVQQAELEVQNSELRTANEELRRTNAALVNAADRFRALYEYAPTPYVTVDSAGTILDLNRACEVMLATPRDHLIGGALHLFVDDAGRAMFRQFVEAVFAIGHDRCGDLTMLGAGGTPGDKLVDGVLLRDEPGQPPRCVLAFTDITARKLAEKARRQAQNEMLAIVSHDLRGPLYAISLAAETLATGVAYDAQSRCAATITRATDRCERLITDLLGMAQLESGHIPVELLPVDADEIVEQASLEHQAAASVARSTLTVTLASEPHLILGDRNRLHQVLSNLIRNALAHARGSAIEVSVFNRGEQVVIAVSDNGPGIPADELPYVFERYRQGANHHGGSGLGLAIVKGVILAHHGTATVTSALGYGARFELSVPRLGA